MRKVAFITGASGGIGSACARALAKDGYAVAIGFSSNESAANELSAELKSQGFDALAVQCDITDSGSIASAVSLIEKDLGIISVLVNNAGIANISLFTDNSYNDLRRMLDTDLLGAMELSRQVLPAMIREKCGNIINISSVWGEKGASCEVAYCAAKAGLIGFTKALAREEAPSGIRVNCISCGYIDTKMNSELSDEDKQAVLDEIPAGRFGTPQDVAGAVSFLVSEKAGYITGQVIRVDGCWI
ncbi:MAG: 3-oxoacyl-ACP reductase FabG [Ruminococcus sp.]|nr:3-oxoacyl-ACP reductase FabG [Ruminococcus sp.]MBQ3937218.1 3-oxoacyl-ACP reductase FabG [Ruminococcus sp.]